MTVAKYSANGNDFVIMHAFVKKERAELARRLCHRQHGIGADGLIVLLPHESLDFEWQFYNADGSEAAMCGNGSRAAAHYAYHHGLAPASMRFLTGAGEIAAEIKAHTVASELTPPRLIRDDIDEAGERWWLIDTGVPHLVAVRASVETFDLNLARRLRRKYDANVNICALQKDALYVRTYERGVEDETLACGTGMAACFYRLRQEAKVSDRIKVIPTGKEAVFLADNGRTLVLEGAVRRTFEAHIQNIDVESHL